MKQGISGLMKIIKFMTDKNVPFSKKLLFFVPILYLIFPLDIIGDFFPLAGQLDDVAVFVIMWPILKNLLVNYSNLKQGEKEKSDRDENKTIDIDDYKLD